MTKYLWFKIIAIVCIVAILVAICIIEDRLVVSSLEEVDNFCFEIEQVAQENGIVDGQVASLVDNLEYRWTENEEKMCFMINHKSIEQIGIEIVRLKTYIDEEEPIEFFVSLKIIQHYCETFQHFMGASFHNIL